MGETQYQRKRVHFADANADRHVQPPSYASSSAASSAMDISQSSPAASRKRCYEDERDGHVQSDSADSQTESTCIGSSLFGHKLPHNEPVARDSSDRRDVEMSDALDWEPVPRNVHVPTASTATAMTNVHSPADSSAAALGQTSMDI